MIFGCLSEVETSERISLCSLSEEATEQVMGRCHSLETLTVMWQQNARESSPNRNQYLAHVPNNFTHFTTVPYSVWKLVSKALSIKEH